MKTSALRQFSALAVVLQLLAVPALSAKDTTHKLSDWKIGKTLFGDKLSKTELKGKVVVIENWGVHCPPCIASLPHLAELEKAHRDEGLRIIGAESQGSSKEQIKPLIEKAKVEYTIVDQADGPLQVSAIPRAFVFGRDGLLVYDGSPLGKPFEEAVLKALSEGGTESATATEVAAETKASLIPSRAWTNTEGREIRAAVKSADDTSVVFLMDGGKEVKYPLEKLSAESRQIIADAAKN